MSKDQIPPELLEAIKCWLTETFDWAEIEEDQYGLNIHIKSGVPNPIGMGTDVLIQFNLSPRPVQSQVKWLKSSVTTYGYGNNYYGVNLSVSCPYGNQEVWHFLPDERAGGMRLKMGDLNKNNECEIANPEFFFDVLTSIIQTSMLISMGRIQPSFYKERIHKSQWAKELREYMNETENAE